MLPCCYNPRWRRGTSGRRVHYLKALRCCPRAAGDPVTPRCRGRADQRLRSPSACSHAPRAAPTLPPFLCLFPDPWASTPCTLDAPADARPSAGVASGELEGGRRRFSRRLQLSTSPTPALALTLGSAEAQLLPIQVKTCMTWHMLRQFRKPIQYVHSMGGEH